MSQTLQKEGELYKRLIRNLRIGAFMGARTKELTDEILRENMRVKAILDEVKQDFFNEFFSGKEIEVPDYMTLLTYHAKYSGRLHEKIVKWFGE